MGEFHTTTPNCDPSSDNQLQVATWNTAGGDKVHKFRQRPLQFFAENRNRDLILLQEMNRATSVAAEYAGFETTRDLPRGLCVAYKTAKLQYVNHVQSEEILGSGGGRNGTAVCCLFQVLTWQFPGHVGPNLKVLNMHGPHNYGLEPTTRTEAMTAAVEAMKRVWLDTTRSQETPLNVIGGDMNECHKAGNARRFVGERCYSEEYTNNDGALDQLGARGNQAIRSATSAVNKRFGSDHKSKTLTITLKSS